MRVIIVIVLETGSTLVHWPTGILANQHLVVLIGSARLWTPIVIQCQIFRGRLPHPPVRGLSRVNMSLLWSVDSRLIDSILSFKAFLTVNLL